MRKMKIALSPGSIGVECTQEEAIGLAHYFGYEAVQPNGRELAAFSSTRLSELPGELSAFGLVWAAAGLGVDFRKDEPLFQEGLAELVPRSEGAAAGRRDPRRHLDHADS